MRPETRFWRSLCMQIAPQRSRVDRAANTGFLICLDSRGFVQRPANHELSLGHRPDILAPLPDQQKFGAAVRRLPKRKGPCSQFLTRPFPLKAADHARSCAVDRGRGYALFAAGVESG